MAINVKLETISPKLSKEWLATSKHNRPLSDARVVEYGLQMEAGKWVENGESIKFNGNGELFDGQHRLQACILAGKSFKSLVVRGVEDERAFATVDVGKVRTPADVFALAGFASPSAIATGARMLYWHEYKLMTPSGPKSRNTAATALITGTRYGHATRINIPPKEELLKFAQDNYAELHAAARVGHNTKTAKLLTPAVAICAYVLFRRKDEASANSFFEDFGRGSELAKNDPVHVLREKIVAARIAGARHSGCTILFYVFKAWNKRRNGEAVTHLRLNEGEPFPKLV